MENEAMTIHIKGCLLTDSLADRGENNVTLPSAVWSWKQYSLAVWDNLILGDYVGDTFRQ